MHINVSFINHDMTKIFLLISVDDLRRLIEKAGGKFEGNLYSESVTMVASMESAGQVSFIKLKIYLFEFSSFEFSNRNKCMIDLFNSVTTCVKMYLVYILQHLIIHIFCLR